MSQEFPVNLESLLSTAVRLLVSEGAAREVAFLTSGDAWPCFNGYEDGDAMWTLWLKLPPHVYARLDGEEQQEAEKRIHVAIAACVRSVPKLWVTDVKLAPRLVADEAWREKAVAWLHGEGINNQGRVRSNNIATRNCDGLLFRSEAEIRLYRALKARGVTFAPLPVFVRGGDSYRRIEPDFIVIHNGTMLAIEVDGDTVHQETPLEAHTRTTMLLHEGAQLERLSASECSTDEGAAVSGCLR